MLSQTRDFVLEVQVLASALQELTDAQWNQETQFKGWTPNDIVCHLHFWNEAADWSVHAQHAFQVRLDSIREQTQRTGSMRPAEQQQVQSRGPALLALWLSFAQDMAQRWQTLDPRQRVDWAGPPMSVRSSLTARQMETWAHGQAIFDMLGQNRPESARLRNIVVLGVNTFAWSHRVRGWDVPAQMPRIELTSPQGENWSFGEVSEAGCVRGSARDFAQVVTQTRHLLDTDLQVQGDVARRWMSHAQCFAGPPEQPPMAGFRHKVMARPG
jgi:uncharacterized protein (TIGR03084 family)